ncbi:GbsR/MarR family transcriptional regulator [Ulvibacter antarcticus]|uniref:Winged helix DNA-binding protein n=1 Tax=Ulvibacter antarcticus TaxID=442714 RepID=A0A3L9YGR5_9FLAO|nr:transcriptional regulator [Ulvibacter antarcticus]RMA58747.1 winged helix DNA-binding protein [Ulvibacter antarcticus]
MSQRKEQAQLIEEIGLGIEERLRLSPLASRIYALLILSSYDGLTFEEIKEEIQATKSSTSVNINVLIQLNYISYYTKPGDRKRYFRLAKYSSLIALEADHQAIDNEMAIIERINTFNKKYHPEKFTNEQTLGHIFQDYLVEKQELVDRVIKKMRSFRESEK